MSLILPFLNATNSPASSKRKCSPLVHKAAPTCTLSLTSVSSSAHGSSDSFNFIPFPSAPASIPFPSSPVSIPTSTSPTQSSPILTPRPRIRTQALPLRRRRSLARLVQASPLSPQPLPSSSLVESEPELVSPKPPRKRARKANPPPPVSSSSPLIPAATGFHSLALSQHQRRVKSLKKAVADLRFMCTLYRSVIWRRAQRELSEASSMCLIKRTMGEDAMDIDMAAGPLPSPLCSDVSTLDVQESLLTSRLRSYLIFNEMDPQWLDVLPTPDPFHTDVVDDNNDMDVVDPTTALVMQDPAPLPSVLTPPSSTTPLLPPPPQLRMMTPDQVTASLLFRFRHRSRGKSRPEAALAGSGGGSNPVEVPVKPRKRSPLAGPEVSSSSSCRSERLGFRC